jgi:DNA-binding transcriptional MerR regulator
MPDTLYIGRVAEQTGLSVHAIRFYEHVGLLNRRFAARDVSASSGSRRSVI